METQEEIIARIDVLEKIGGYSIEIDELRTELEKADSIKDLQVRSFEAGRNYNTIKVKAFPSMLQLDFKYKTFKDYEDYIESNL